MSTAIAHPPALPAPEVIRLPSQVSVFIYEGEVDSGWIQQAGAWFESLWKGMPPVDIRMVHRSSVDQAFDAWYREYDPDAPSPLPPYQFRAWADAYTETWQVVLIVDDTETPESLFWLLWHELAHLAVRHSPLLETYFHLLQGDVEPWAGSPTMATDDEHEADPEEQFVNSVATRITGGPCFDRRWWRRRVEQLRGVGGGR